MLHLWPFKYDCSTVFVFVITIKLYILKLSFRCKKIEYFGHHD
jgi:hypothetical protein